jgi:hypothetical protein
VGHSLKRGKKLSWRNNDMYLAQIKQEIKKSLSVAEKLQLITDITHMLQKDFQLSKYFEKEAIYPIFTPLGMEEAAIKLQEYLNNGVL